jgi:threonine aldolase
MGGGMRQAGYLAAAGIYALENNVERLAEDHRRAKTLADALATYPWIARVMPAETNIVIAHLECAGADLVAYLADNGVKAGTMGPKMVRFVFHLQVTDADLDRVVTLLRKFEG